MSDNGKDLSGSSPRGTREEVRELGKTRADPSLGEPVSPRPVDGEGCGGRGPGVLGKVGEVRPCDQLSAVGGASEAPFARAISGVGHPGHKVPRLLRESSSRSCWERPLLVSASCSRVCSGLASA